MNHRINRKKLKEQQKISKWKHNCNDVLNKRWARFLKTPLKLEYVGDTLCKHQNKD